MICLGGNLAVAMSDPQAVFEGMRRLDLAVHIATKLNRSHLLLAEESIILPCLGRTEADLQPGGPQMVTVEDSMSMVHASRGGLKPASEHLRSEPAIVAGLAMATLPATKVDWRGLASDYAQIRDKIALVFPDFADFNARVAEPGGFRLPVAASERQWRTASGKAHFLVHPGAGRGPAVEGAGCASPDDRAQSRSIQHHHLWPGRPIPRCDRAAGRDLLQRQGSRREGPQPRRPGGCRGRARNLGRKSPPAARLHRRRLRYRRRIGWRPTIRRLTALVALDHYDEVSGTPSYKSVPVMVRRAENP